MTERRATWIALLMAAIYFVVLWITAPAMGFTRDESYYFKAAEEYGRWWDVLFSSRFFEAFKDEEIKRHFSYNTEHPALVKILFGLSERLLHDLFGVKESQAYRAVGFFFGGLSLFATYLLGRALVSWRAGLLAALLLATQPRYFFDAHLACFDVAIASFWTLSLWAFWRAFEVPTLKRVILAGVIFGLALATKLNALFLPVVFVAIWIWRVLIRGGFGFRPGPSGSRELVLPPIPWVLIACAVIGPIIFYLHWPYLWHHPFERTAAYVAFHLHHEHYPILFFHQLLVKPPFPIGFSFVMSFYTLPAPILILGALGFVHAVVRMVKRRSLADALLVAATFLPFFLLSLPSTPIFGGVKHWYNAMPTLSILAARAILHGVEAVRAERLRPALAIGLAVIAALPGALGMIASHPNGIGFYNEIAGGFRGGAELGMQRGFWGGQGDPLFQHFFDLPPRSYIFFNRSTYDSYRMHQREGTLPKDVYYANDAKGLAAAGIYFEQPEHGEREGEIWSNLGTRPIDGVYKDGVVLIQLYVRGKSDRPPPANKP